MIAKGQWNALQRVFIEDAVNQALGEPGHDHVDGDAQDQQEFYP